MAVTDAIGAVFAAEFNQLLYQDNPWMQVVDDHSAELGYGDTLTLNYVPYNITVNDTTKAEAQGRTIADHKWGDPNLADTGKIDLVIDKYKDIDEAIPDFQIAQIRPSIVAEKAQQAARKVMEQMNNDIRATVLASTDADFLLTQIDVTATNFATPNAAFKTAVKDRIGDAQQELDEAYVADDGRVMMTSPKMYRVLEDTLIEDKLFLVQGANDQAAIQGMVPMYKGFGVRKDNSAGAGETNTDDAKHAMYFLRPGRGIAFAQQVRKLRVFESEVIKGIRIQGQFSYGTVLNFPKEVRIAKVNIT